MNLFLVGYMASGKSTIGQALANKMSFKFIDLDQYIENKEDMSISEIFAKKGEILFRKLETKYLTTLIEEDGKNIISLGGGTPCYGDNLQLLLDAPKATTIYLKASIKELVSRLMKDKEQRPLIAHLKSEDALLEFVGKHLFERSMYYSQASRTVAIDNKTTEDVVNEIIAGLF